MGGWGGCAWQEDGTGSGGNSVSFALWEERFARPGRGTRTLTTSDQKADEVITSSLPLERKVLSEGGEERTTSPLPEESRPRSQQDLQRSEAWPEEGAEDSAPDFGRRKSEGQVRSRGRRKTVGRAMTSEQPRASESGDPRNRSKSKGARTGDEAESEEILRRKKGRRQTLGASRLASPAEDDVKAPERSRSGVSRSEHEASEQKDTSQKAPTRRTLTIPDRLGESHQDSRGSSRSPSASRDTSPSRPSSAGKERPRPGLAKASLFLKALAGKKEASPTQADASTSLAPGRSGSARPSFKAAVDFASMVKRKKSKKKTVVEEEKPDAAPPPARDIELIRKTFSSARRAMMMRAPAHLSSRDTLKLAIRAVGKAAKLVMQARRAKAIHIMRTFVAAKRRADFEKEQEAFNPQVQMDDIMEEHVTTIFWQLVLFRVDGYDLVVPELLKAFAEPNANVPEAMPELRKVLEAHLRNLEQEVEDAVLAGDHDASQTASQTKKTYKVALEKIMEEASTIRSLVVYSRTISRMGRMERSERAVKVNSDELLSRIMQLDVTKNLLSNWNDEDERPIRVPRRRRKKAVRVEDEEVEVQEVKPDSDSSRTSESSQSSQSSQSSESEEQEDQDQEDQKEEEEENQDASHTQLFDEILAGTLREDLYTPTAPSTECPEEESRLTPLDLTGPTPTPLPPLPELEHLEEVPEAHRSFTDRLSLARQASRGSQQRSGVEGVEGAADAEAMALRSSSYGPSIVRQASRSSKQSEHPSEPFPSRSHSKRSGVSESVSDEAWDVESRVATVEFSWDWQEVLNQYMDEGHPEDFVIEDNQGLELAEDPEVSDFPLTVHKKVSDNDELQKEAEGRPRRKLKVRSGRRSSASFQWQVDEEPAQPASLPTPQPTPQPALQPLQPVPQITLQPSQPQETHTQELPALEEGSEESQRTASCADFEWLQESALPRKVKLQLWKFRAHSKERAVKYIPCWTETRCATASPRPPKDRMILSARSAPCDG
ncbi:unnamed protein product [Effrenium voratum]|uniref:Uncharacterized protein n=1 Tax=Effrenium voratum TaxID=2562239 RepID=A0AA36HV78_9DINO|nr:unnamed protein product [Effrenium voratum]